MSPRLSVMAGALCLAAAAPAAGTEYVRRCPEGSLPARTTDAKQPWVCALSDPRHRAVRECPEGTRAVTTTRLYEPFGCALVGVRLILPRGSCPPGQRPAPSARPDKDYECEDARSPLADAKNIWAKSVVCAAGTAPVPTPGRSKPYQCLSLSNEAPKKGTAHPEKLNYRSCAIPGAAHFRCPRGWSATDAWSEDVPSFFLLHDAGGARPVSLTISRQRELSPSFRPMEEMMLREKAWRGAFSDGNVRVAGKDCIQLIVPHEAEMAFVPAKNGYFIVTYGAPEDSFERFLPAYRKLLESFVPEAAH